MITTLVDRVYEAGLEFVTEVGMFCQDTSRRILWTRAEYEEGLHDGPSEADMLGTGNDAIDYSSTQAGRCGYPCGWRQPGMRACA